MGDVRSRRVLLTSRHLYLIPADLYLPPTPPRSSDDVRAVTALLSEGFRRPAAEGTRAKPAPDAQVAY